MKTVAIKKYLPIENPESFLDVEMIKPEPAGHDILVAVKTIAVNPVDTKIRALKDSVLQSVESTPISIE